MHIDKEKMQCYDLNIIYIGGAIMSNKIMIVDDDKNICRLLDLYLKNEGYETIICNDGSEALNALDNQNIDLVLLDLMLPVINGWEVCRLIRRDHNIPIIMITARDMLEDKISGFDAGADDYIVKPFEPKEVIARVKARLRGNIQKNTNNSEILQFDNLIIDINKYEIKINDKTIPLKPKEIQLLYFLAKNKNIVFSRDKLLECVWEYNFSGDTRTVDVHIKRLREKLNDESKHWRIKTIWGVGYKFETTD